MGQQGMPIFVGLRGMDINDLQVNLEKYRQAWHEAGHSGDGDVSLRIPIYAGDTEQAALEEPSESIHAYFSRMSSLYRESAGSAGTEATELRQGRGDRLASMTFENMLVTKVAFGSAEGLVTRLSQLEEDLGIRSVIAELNPGGLIPPERVMHSMEILAKDVAPHFK
jgi:alkanesulfonate monooxygenase SsuD/methylene tetrahydromethanopterin reductase-like flavin-dependent oxidoreductase (luciferase family)